MYTLLVTLVMSLLVAGPVVAGTQPSPEQPSLPARPSFPGQPPSPGQPSFPGQPSTPGQPVPQDKARIRQVQERLRAFGFNPGPQNGDMHNQTVSALRQFQKARGLPETGMLDGATHQALFSQPSVPSGRTPRGTPRPR